MEITTVKVEYRDDLTEASERERMLAAGYEEFEDFFEPYEIAVGKGCFGTYYSDHDPFEVVRIVSDKCVEVRPLVASANLCVWPEQEHLLFRDASKKPRRVRLHKDGRWMSRDGMKFSFRCADEWRDPSF